MIDTQTTTVAPATTATEPKKLVNPTENEVAILDHVQELFNKDREQREEKVNELKAVAEKIDNAARYVRPGVPPAPKPEKLTFSQRLKHTLGLGQPRARKPVQVSVTEAEALASLRSGEPTPEVMYIAEAGMEALAISAAFRANVVTGPNRGLTPLQIAGIAATAGIAAGGAAYAVSKYNKAKAEAAVQVQLEPVPEE